MFITLDISDPYPQCPVERSWRVVQISVLLSKDWDIRPGNLALAL